MYTTIEQLQIQTPNDLENGHLISGGVTEFENQEQILLQHALVQFRPQFKRLSLQDHSKKTYSKQNGLPQKYYKMIKNMKMSKSSQSCTVCLHHFQTDQIIKRFPCKHIFHRQCAKKWLKINKTCPVCRLNLETHLQIEMKQQTKIIKS